GFHVHAPEALEGAADEHIRLRNRVARQALHLRQEDAVPLAELIRHRREEEWAEEVQALERDFRKRRLDLAVVSAGAARAETTGAEEAARQPRVEVHVHAVVVLD